MYGPKWDYDIYTAVNSNDGKTMSLLNDVLATFTQV